MKRGFANLPLHGGRAPRWLFARMRKMAGAVAQTICEEFGPDELLVRLSDPAWFQAFGCVLGFDWHSSGVTTTVCGALKEGTRAFGPSVGLFVGGGKGGRSRRTPQEIEQACERLGRDPAPLVYASRMSAKVDSAALQDGYQIYQHCFLFTTSGRWAVVQQGMNDANGYARRYHWLADHMDDFVCEPHAAIAAQARGATLNMVASESGKARDASADASRLHPDKLLAEVTRLQALTLPRHHEVLLRDPAVYSFAHGGKDGHPYPVNREVYDQSIDFLRRSIDQAKLGHSDKRDALRQLARFLSREEGVSRRGSRGGHRERREDRRGGEGGEEGR